jgi:hypothetical protein
MVCSETVHTGTFVYGLAKVNVTGEAVAAIMQVVSEHDASPVPLVIVGPCVKDELTMLK